MKVVGALGVAIVTLAGACAIILAAIVHLPLAGAARVGVGIAVAALACLALPLWFDAVLTRAARRQDVNARGMPGRAFAAMNLLWIVGLGVADHARVRDYVSVVRKVVALFARPRPADQLPSGFSTAARELSIEEADAPDKPLAYATPRCPLRYGFITETKMSTMAAVGHSSQVDEGLGIRGTYAAVPGAGRLTLRDFDVRVRRHRDGEAALPFDLPGTSYGQVLLSVDGSRVRALEGASPLWEDTAGIIPLSDFYPQLPGAARWIRVGGELAAMFTIRRSLDGNEPADAGTPELSTSGELVAHYVVLASGWPLYADVEATANVIIGTKSVGIQQKQKMTARLHLIGTCVGPTLPDPRRPSTPAEAAIEQYELFLAALMTGHPGEAAPFFTSQVLRAHGAAKLESVLRAHVERRGAKALGILWLEPEILATPSSVALRLVGLTEPGNVHADVRIEERDGHWRIAMICVNRARPPTIGAGCDLLDIRGDRLSLAPAP
ncbi:MAG TPA: hypothetical protein VN903_36705 [Polyangia bacterium]|nr:hypothetical protein [Polyangia bacterium]